MGQKQHIPDPPGNLKAEVKGRRLWERIVPELERGTRPSKAAREGFGRIADRSLPAVYIPEAVFKGWIPTCKCDTQGTGKCIVLDPFCGSGTTGMVARRQDRKFIGLELSPKYFQMTVDRIEKDIPLFNVDWGNKDECKKEGEQNR